MTWKMYESRGNGASSQGYRGRDEKQAGCNAGTPPSDAMAAKNPQTWIIKYSSEHVTAVLNLTSRTSPNEEPKKKTRQSSERGLIRQS